MLDSPPRRIIGDLTVPRCRKRERESRRNKSVEFCEIKLRPIHLYSIPIKLYLVALSSPYFAIKNPTYREI